MGKLRCSVTAARRCLARGDARGAVAAIDHAQAWRIGDIQACARVAEAYLHSDAHDPVDEFHKLLALSAFDACSGPDIEHYLLDRLAFPGAKLRKEELAALVAQVRAWLDEHAERDPPGAAGAPG